MKFISAIVAFSAVAALVQAGSLTDPVMSTVQEAKGVASGVTGGIVQKRELIQGVSKALGLSPNSAQAESGAVAKRDVKANVDVKLQAKIDAIINACVHAVADVKIKANLAVKILAEIKAKVDVHIDAKLEAKILGKLIKNGVVVLDLMCSVLIFFPL
jgi:hypothetical protein